MKYVLPVFAFSVSYIAFFLLFDALFRFRFFFGLSAVFIAIFLFSSAFALVAGGYFLFSKRRSELAQAMRSSLSEFRKPEVLIPLACVLGFGLFADSSPADENVSASFVLVPMFVLFYMPFRIARACTISSARS